MLIHLPSDRSVLDRETRTTCAKRLARWVCLIGACCLVAACGSASGSVPGEDDESRDGTDGDSGQTEESIAFVPSFTLTLQPEQLTTLQVTVTPDRRQSVTFELLSESSGFDGFLLSGSERVEGGKASTEMKAPSQPAVFMVRASLESGHSAIRAVSVSDRGYASVKVTPNYTGLREIAQWTASARTGVTCEELKDFYTDGPLIATGARSALITDVPVGPIVAVTVRGGELAAGCITLPQVSSEGETAVVVEIADRPLNTQTGVLDLTFGVDSSTDEFAAHLNQAILVGLLAFHPESHSDAEELLIRMAAGLTPDDAEAFTNAAETAAFADSIEAVWGAISPLTDAARTHLTDAASAIPGEATFRGVLTLEPSSAQFSLTHAAGVKSSSSGFFQESDWMVTAESGDTLVLGGALTYEPLRWLASIATTHSPSPSEDLQAAAKCGPVAEALIGAHGGATHGTCEEECVQALCEEAVTKLFPEISMAGNELLTSLTIAASAHANVQGDARIAGLEGTWVGRLDEEQTSLKGKITGTEYAPALP